jgi:beta-lactamase regulating signal transducer with metallopeptidase domain/Tol biopolymer transport system component
MSALIELGNRLAAAWSEALVRASWQGGLVLLFAGLVCRAWPSLAPRAQCWLWRLAYLKLLLALAGLPALDLPLLPPAPAAARADPAAPGQMPRSGPQRSSPGGAGPATQELSLPPETEEARPTVACWLLAGWLLGVAVCAARLVRGWRTTGLLREGTWPVQDEELLRCRDQLARRMVVPSAPELRWAAGSAGPLLVGVSRPAILLPAECMPSCSLGEVRLMLAHELAHARRRDLLWGWLPAVVRALFFFHPLVAWAGREWRLAQEMACDELALRATKASPGAYGEVLLKVVPSRGRGATVLLAVGVVESYRTLKRRLNAMKYLRYPSRAERLLAAGMILALAAAGLVPWRLTARPADTPQAEGTAVAAKLPGRIFLSANLRTRLEGQDEEKNLSAVFAIDPNTGAWKKITDQGHRGRVSPDGQTLAFSMFPAKDEIWSCDTQGSNNPGRICDRSGIPLWSPDGKELLVSHSEPLKDKKSGSVWKDEAWRVSLGGGEAVKLPIPESDEVDDWSPDGRWVVTVSDRHPPHGSGYQLYVMHLDGSAQRRLTQGRLNCYPRFSPDSRRIVYCRQTRKEEGIWVVNVDGSDNHCVYRDDSISSGGACWSPDGKHLAAVIHDWEINEKGQKFLGNPENGHFRIEIMDTDGQNRHALELPGAKMLFAGMPDWQ